MSYTFEVLAATKDDAKQKVATAFDGVVKTYPEHKADQAAAVAAASAYVDMLRDLVENEEVRVGVHGSLSMQHGTSNNIAASVTVSAHIRTKKVLPVEQPSAQPVA